MAVKSSTWNLMVEGTALEDAVSIRKKSFIEKTIDLGVGLTVDKNALTSEGWTIKKQTKNKVYIEKEKPQFDLFEDQVWMLFYRMGFKILNSDNSFSVVYSDQNGKQLSKQIDVLAVDDDVCVCVECKSTEVEGTVPDFRTDINEIAGIRDSVFKEILSQYPNRKMVYVFATNGYVLGEQDKNRLRVNNIIHFDNPTILYYQSLSQHLGKATKYQLLGSLFSGQEIEGLDCTIPAIKGKMQNGLTYYTFIIQPAKLLTIGYILHRTNANNDYEDLLPSYQRIIKKDRLKSVRDFVESGGFFPNSLIVSVDSDGPLEFNEVDSQDGLYSMGRLHLPKRYQSLYIIDGQHRLYGYSDSKKAHTETVPVVAFENLDKREQLRLFMDINENQKAVPKALRNILLIDINYDSNNPKDRQDALLGRIAKRLGEDRKSPLFQRVVIGEDSTTDRCCVTLDYIKDGLKATGLFNEYRGTKITKRGLFDDDNNDVLFAKTYPIITGYLQIFKNALEQEWSQTGSWLIKNTVVYAMLAVLGDILRIVTSKSDAPFKNATDLLASINELSLKFVLVLDNLDSAKRNKIKESLGGAAKGIVYRLLQMTFHEEFPEFTDDEIDEYYRISYQDYTESAKTEIKMISTKLIADTKKLIDGPGWMKTYLSIDRAKNIVQKKATEQVKYDFENNNGATVSEWDVMSLSDVISIYSERSNWSETFSSYFNRLGYNDSKMEMISKLKSIVECETHIKNGRQIKKSEYDVVHGLYLALSKENE